MKGTRIKTDLKSTIMIGVLYFVVGVLFGELSASATSRRAFFTWRFAAWVVSAAVYGAHIAFEHFKLRNSPRALATHTAVAVGLGAFLLAVAATVHAFTVPTHAPYWLFAVALVAWPLITAVPALLVAFVIGLMLTRLAPQNNSLPTNPAPQRDS